MDQVSAADSHARVADSLAGLSWRLAYQSADPELVIRTLESVKETSYVPGQFEQLQRIGRPAVLALIRVAMGLVLPEFPPERVSLANMAIRALGDVPSSEGVSALLEIAERLNTMGGDRRPWHEETLDLISVTLHRLGRPQLADTRIKRALRRLRASTSGTTRWMRRLGTLLYRLGRHEESAGWFVRLAEASPQDHGTSLYMAAAVWARGGHQRRALDVLRRAVIPVEPNARAAFQDVDWMLRDRDMRGLRDSPEFSYLCAAITCLQLRRTDAGQARPDSAVIARALSWLGQASDAGYRIVDQRDRERVFGPLLGVAEFEALWRRLGGSGD